MPRTRRAIFCPRPAGCAICRLSGRECPCPRRHRRARGRCGLHPLRSDDRQADRAGIMTGRPRCAACKAALAATRGRGRHHQSRLPSAVARPSGLCGGRDRYRLYRPASRRPVRRTPPAPATACWRWRRWRCCCWPAARCGGGREGVARSLFSPGTWRPAGGSTTIASSSALYAMVRPIVAVTAHFRRGGFTARSARRQLAVRGERGSERQARGRSGGDADQSDRYRAMAPS